MSTAEKITCLNQTVLESLDEREETSIMGKFTETAINILGADFGFAWLKKEGDSQFRLAYKSEHMPYEPATPRKKGTNQRVLQKQLPLFVPDVGKSKSVRADALPHMQAFVSMPIVYKSNTYGNIIVCYKQVQNFTNEEKSLAVALGNTSAQAITINRLYRNVKLSNADLETRVYQRTKELINSRNKIRLDKAKDEALLESIGEGILATDAHGIIFLINPQAEKILGRKATTLIGRSLYKVQPIFDEKGNQLPLQERPSYKAINGKAKTTHTRHVFYKRSNGTLIPVSITATPVIHKKKTIGFIQVFRDISKEKEIDRVKSELISLASHQLRTPLSAINWYTEALVKEEVGKLSKNQKRYLLEIYHANQKMVELVYDFLNVSRIELGTFSIKLSNLNIPEISKSIIAEIRPVIGQKKMHIIEQYGKGLGNIEADRKIIRLILQNLITNAVKYTPDKGTIKIILNLSSDNKKRPLLHLQVSDNGHGIPKHQQNKIFTKLFRADNAAKMDAQGSGLGLYLVKSFVDFCKGKITFNSRENKGTTFSILLPVHTKKNG